MSINDNTYCRCGNIPNSTCILVCESDALSNCVLNDAFVICKFAGTDVSNLDKNNCIACSESAHELFNPKLTIHSTKS